MEEAFMQSGFRLAFPAKNIHTAAMILLLLIGMLAAEDLATKADVMRADQVIVLKSQRTLTLLSQGKVLRTYRVALGSSPVGAKEQQGDHKTPEGHYVLDRRNANSRFYKSIHVSYPNEQDKKKAAQRGVSAGGDIMIHGLPNGFGWLDAAHRALDWTDGCIAVTNTEMDEIWELIADGTSIDIRP
jgi:murein L,D-transpeptidase YafK